MKIKALKQIKVGGETVKVGGTAECSDAEARYLVGGGLAEYADKPKAKKSAKKDAEE